MVRELSRLFPATIYHQWICYTDATGKECYAEPEGWIEFPSRVLLFECKRTGSLHGRRQMEWTYKPLLEYLFAKPVQCLLICKYVTKETPGPFFGNVEEFLRTREPFGTWHHLGN